MSGDKEQQKERNVCNLVLFSFYNKVDSSKIKYCLYSNNLLKNSGSKEFGDFRGRSVLILHSGSHGLKEIQTEEGGS